MLFNNIQKELNMKSHFSIEDSIPIVSIKDSGLLKSINNRYSLSYKLTDINYKLNDREQQRLILDLYKQMLNSFNNTSEFQFSIFNTKLSSSFMEDNVYYKPCGDGLDAYREAANETIKENIIDDEKAFIKEKVITISLECDDEKDANKNIKLLEEVLKEGIGEIDGAHLLKMDATELLKYLYSIYNIKKKNSFDNKVHFGRKNIEVFTMANATRQGISAKELVQPSSMYIENDYLRLGDTYIRALYLDNINKQVDTECVDKICSVDFNMLLTCKLKQMEIDDAIKLAKDELLNVEGAIANITQKQKEAGFMQSLVPRDLEQRHEEALDANDALKVRDEKMFDFSLYTLIFADSLEELKENTEKFKQLCKGKGLYFVVGRNIQENIFNSCLPLGLNQTTFKRSIDTEGASAFIPFSSPDLMQPHGDFYGKNKITHSPILYDMMSGDNFSSLIFGMSGKGKSFTAKNLILAKRLRNAYRETIIFDPNGEWGPLVSELKGQEIMITSGGEHHINLFDIDISYGDNPFADKEDFILSVTKQMLHSPFGLSAGQTTTTAKAISMIYDKWLKTYNKNDIPTIEDYYEALLSIANESQEREDIELCKAVKYYCKDSQNSLFRGCTDVDITKNIISYNLANLGATFKPLAMQILLDNVWTRVCKNHKRGIPTDLIIDEFHLMFNGEAETAIWMEKFWKMFRKFLGCPVGITQNPGDLLKSLQGQSVILNSSLNVILSLKLHDRELLGEIITLTKEQNKYITDQPSGEGILYIPASKNLPNTTIIPFVNNVKKTNLVYKLINTSS